MNEADDGHPASADKPHLPRMPQGDKGRRPVCLSLYRGVQTFQVGDCPQDDTDRAHTSDVCPSYE